MITQKKTNKEYKADYFRNNWLLEIKKFNLTHKKMQIETSMIYHSLPTRFERSNGCTTNCDVKDVWKQVFSHIAVNNYQIL